MMKRKHERSMRKTRNNDNNNNKREKEKRGSERGVMVVVWRRNSVGRREHVEGQGRKGVEKGI